MHVVLVHGFLNRGGILRNLAAHLTRAGHICYTPSLKPCDARWGLPALAEALKSYVSQQLPPDSRFALVGFSMGAIVSRYYLQELNGADRVLAFFSIAGPHQGTLSAHLYPSLGVRQLRRGSDFLLRLDSSAYQVEHLPITCYWTPYDIMIRPLASTRWNAGESVRIPALQHSLLVFDKRLHSDIEHRLSNLSA